MGDIFSLKISVVLTLFLFVFGDGKALAGESPFCIDRVISTEKENLKCLKNHVVTRSIKDRFEKIIRRKRECTTCSPEFPREDNFSPLFGLNFLTLKIERNPFGGYFSYATFRESPRRIYRLWIYKIDDDVFRIREIKSIEIDAKLVQTLRVLKTPTYNQFWF